MFLDPDLLKGEREREKDNKITEHQNNTWDVVQQHKFNNHLKHNSICINVLRMKEE